MTGCNEEAHYGAHWLAGVCYCYCVVAHVGKVSSRLGVAPAYRLIVNVSEEPLGFAATDLLGSGGAMLGSDFRCRVPVLSGGIVKAAIAARPMRKVGKRLIKQLKIVLQ